MKLFIPLLTTFLMLIMAAREFKHGNHALGLTLSAVPTAGWIAIWFEGMS